MGFGNGLVWFCFWGVFMGFSDISVFSQNVTDIGEGTVLIDGREAIGKTDEDFICATLDWWPPEKCDYGTCSWGLASMLNLDLNNKILINAIKAFSPLKLRLGGSLQDKVIYDVGYPREPCKQFVANSSEMFGFTQGCLPMPRWDELNKFFNETGAVIVFGLNALTGRTIMPDGSAAGPWSSDNAATFIRYTVNKGYKINGWELGNELSGTGVGTYVPADQYASDVNSLYTIIQDIYKDSRVKPLVIAPGGFYDHNWFQELVNKTPNSINAVTHHIYNLGPGVDEHLIEKILDPGYLDGEANTFSSLQSILKNSSTKATAWVGEAGGAYNSGHNLVTNAFVFGFWYLDQLGMAASYDTKTYCRQTLIGGNYGLLNTTTSVPNPDYYSALLWHRLMGRTVLKTNFTGTNKIRAYSHCSKESKGITLLLINLDGNTTIQVHVKTESSTSVKTLTLHSRHHKSKSKSKHHSSRSRYGKRTRLSKIANYKREEYHLTAKDGNIQSQAVLLNGKILAVNSSGEIPPLEPITVNVTEPIIVAPYSIVFVHIPRIHFHVCR